MSTQAQSTCRLCSAGPRGIGGHEELALVRFDHGKTDLALFECSRCRARWRRQYRGFGFFEWRPEGEEAAVYGPRCALATIH